MGETLGGMKRKVLMMAKDRGWLAHVALPAATVVVYYAYLQSYITLIDGDTSYFLAASDMHGFIPFLIMRYQTWTSRLIIEGVLVVMSHMPLLWFCVNLLVVLSIWCCLYRVVSIGVDKQYAGWLSLVLVVLYPFSVLSSAGWMATILNYLWPLAALLFIVCDGLQRVGLIAELSTDEASDNKQRCPGSVSAAISLLLSIFVANLEQGAVLLCLLSACFVFLGRKKSRCCYLYIAELAIGIAGILFALTCPGNGARAASEVGNWWPAFEQLSLAGKIANGLEATTDRYLFGGCSLLLILTSVLMVVTWNQHRSWGFKAMITLSLIIQFAVPELVRRGLLVRPVLNGEPVVLSILVLGALAFALVFICLMGAFRKSRLALFVAILCCAAFASRMVLAFSPTLYASVSRTFIFLDYSIILVIAILLARFKLKDGWGCALYSMLIWFAALNVHSSIAFVVGA